MSGNEGYRRKFMEHVDGFMTAKKELSNQEFIIRTLLKNQGIDLSHDDMQQISTEKLEALCQAAFPVRNEEVKIR